MEVHVPSAAQELILMDQVHVSHVLLELIAQEMVIAHVRVAKKVIIAQGAQVIVNAQQELILKEVIPVVQVVLLEHIILQQVNLLV